MNAKMRPIWDAALLARLAGDEELKPALYVLATPIGHLGDLSLRAIRLLAEADEIWCEDTRVTRRLLSALKIRKRLNRFDAHSPPTVLARILDAVAAGARVVVASDAGTPLVSDPGAALVAEAHRRHLAVVPVPGPSALTAALSVAGMPAPPVLFCGFPPPRAPNRRRWLEGVAEVPATLVIYEAPHRIARSAADMLAVLGDRPVVLARELTKRHEEIQATSLAALAERLGAEPPRGEIVLVVGPPGEESPASGQAGREEEGALAEAEVKAMLAAEAARRPPAQAARIVARRTGWDRRRLYQMLMADKAGDRSGRPSADDAGGKDDAGATQ